LRKAKVKEISPIGPEETNLPAPGSGKPGAPLFLTCCSPPQATRIDYQAQSSPASPHHGDIPASTVQTPEIPPQSHRNTKASVFWHAHSPFPLRVFVSSCEPIQSTFPPPSADLLDGPRKPLKLRPPAERP
jgi:hypothetical protein